jgi:hypothetical protein
VLISVYYAGCDDWQKCRCRRVQLRECGYSGWYGRLWRTGESHQADTGGRLKTSLAINGLSTNGGQVIRKRPFSAWPHYEEDEVAAAMLVLQSGRVNYWTGQEGRQFEEEYAAFVGAKYAVALMNGSVALEAALPPVVKEEWSK